VAQIRRHHWVWFCKAGAIQLSIKWNFNDAWSLRDWLCGKYFVV
jgi:hypothetical protein